jgi:RNA polymerase sigma-70 factor, ECF subfamily
VIQDPDHALIQAIANGSTQALDELYARYGPAVLNFLVARLNSREVAEEVLQDVMLAVWHNAAGFRGDSKVLTWLLTIARNRAINTYRKRKPDVVEFNDELDLHGDETGPLERVVKQDRYEAVKAALDTLPSDHREVLILVFYHQLTGNEIAEVLGTPVGTVKSRLHRAKESLRRVLTSEGRL